MKKNSLIKTISVVIIMSTLFSGCSQPVTDDANTESNYDTQVESTTLYEFEKDGYSLLMNGVYVDNLPGIYDKAVEINARTENGTLYYKTGENEKYRKWNGTVKLDATVGKIGDYPCTTAVDGILENFPGFWKSENYINNVQKKGNYTLFEKQPELFVRFEGNDETACERVFSYIIDAENRFENLPVVSLHVSFNEMFGKNGIYNDVLGDAKIWGTMNFLDVNPDLSFTAETSIKIGGNSTVGYPQRTLNLNFNRDSSGNKNSLGARLVFGDALSDTGSKLDDITRFRLHNGGNSFESSIGFNDAFLQNIFDGTHVSTAASRPAAAYINGEFWGFYMLREKWSDTFINDNYGIKKDSVVIMYYDDHFESPYFVDEGDEKNALDEIKKFESFYLNNDLSVKKNYERLEKEYLDVDSFIDFIIARSFSCDTDSIIKAANNKLWKSTETNDNNPYADGRWRFGIHDADFAFTNQWINLLDKDVEGSFCEYPLLDSLLKNEDFRNRLYKRAKELVNTSLSYENTSSVLRKTESEITKVKKLQFLRWGGTDAEYSTWKKEINSLDNRLKTLPDTYLNGLKEALEKYGPVEI